jgi:hypothetical protein
MARRFKPAIPANIQALMSANEMHCAAVEQARIQQAKANETRFREEHSSFCHNAEVRRNARRTLEEAKLARLDLILDRRARLTDLLASERLDWERELQERNLAIWRPPA